MEIGLTARVNPEVDERKAGREASKLEERMQTAVEDLEADLEMHDIDDRLEVTQEHTERISEDLQTTTDSMNRMSSSMEGMDFSALSNLDDDAEAFDIISGPTPKSSPAPGGGDDDQTGFLRDLRDTADQQRIFAAKRLTQAQSIRGILGGMGRMFTKKGGKVALAGLGLIMLSRMAGKISQASPMLGAVSDMLGLAMKLFFMPFGNIMGRLLMPIAEGVLRTAAFFNEFMFTLYDDGLITAMDYLLTGIANTVLTMEGTTLRNIAAMGAGLLMLRRIGVRGILSMLIPSVGGRGAIQALMTRLGLSGLGSRIIGAMGLRGFVGRLLGRMGLRGLVGRLTARLAGSLVPGLNAVLWGDLIFDLIFGFSPIFDVLIPALIDGFMWLVDGVRSLGAFLAGIAGAMTMDNLMGVLGGIRETLGNLWTWFISRFDPIAAIFGFVLPLLGMFSIFAFDFFELFDDGWGIITGALETLQDWLDDPSLPFNFGGDMEGSIPGMSDVESAFDDAADFIDSGGDIAGDALEDAGDYFSSAGDTASNAIDSAGESLDGALSSASDWVSSRGDDLRGSLGSLNTRFGDFSEDITETLGDFDVGLSESSDAVERAIDGFGEGVRERSESVRSTFEDDVLPAIGDAGNDVSERLSGLAGDLRDNAGDIDDRFSDLANDVRDRGSDLRTSIGNIANFLLDTDNWPSFSVDDITGVITWPNINPSDITGSINWPDIQASDVTDKISWPDFDVGDAFATGGVVTSPTVATVGEREPEVIVPFSKLGAFVGAMSSGERPTGIIPDANRVPKLTPSGTGSGGGTSETFQALMSSPDMPSVGGSGSTAEAEIAIDLRQVIESESEELSERDLADAIRDALGDELKSIERSIDDMASDILRKGLTGDIVLVADDKVLAEADDNGTAKYKRTREVTK